MRLPVGGNVEGGARRGLLTDSTVTLTGKEEDEEEDEDHSRVNSQSSDTRRDAALALPPVDPSGSRAEAPPSPPHPRDSVRPSVT